MNMTTKPMLYLPPFSNPLASSGTHSSQQAASAQGVLYFSVCSLHTVLVRGLLPSTLRCCKLASLVYHTAILYFLFRLVLRVLPTVTLIRPPPPTHTPHPPPRSDSNEA